MRINGMNSSSVDAGCTATALAAADEAVTTAETNFIRQTATALGLTQSDYNSLQAKYKNRQSVLQKQD